MRNDGSEGKRVNTFHHLIQRYFFKTSLQSSTESLEALLRYYCKFDVNIRNSTLQNGCSTNFIEIARNPHSAKKSTLVLTHGLGLGLGFYYANIDALSAEFDRVVALDWSGMGGSSRGSWTISPTPLRFVMISLLAMLPKSFTARLPLATNVESYNNNNHEEQVVDFFIDDIENWRVKELGAESKIVLVGHSFGGFLSTRFALKYPEAVQGLVLASPAGLPLHPAPDVRVKACDLRSGPLVMTSLWNMNVTPQGILRSMGPCGPFFLMNVFFPVRQGGVDRWSPHEKSLLSRYLYHISVARPSGEYAQNSLLMPIFHREQIAEGLKAERSSMPHMPQTLFSMPRGGSKGEAVRGGVYARRPLHPMMPSLGAARIPVLIMFGDSDWMAYPELASDVAEWSTGKDDIAGVDVELIIVPKAGHHLYLDNAPHFNGSVISWARRHHFID